MINILLIFIGAGLGGVCRYIITRSVYYFLTDSFPYGTLVVNASGSFLMGLLFPLLVGRVNELGPELRSLILIGFLGGYTTFSAFSIETLKFLETGALEPAALNIFGSVFLCIGLTWLGILCGRQF